MRSTSSGVIHDAAGPADDVAELLAGAPHRGRVDDRQELLEVLGEEPVEERRVAVLERRQADVLLEVVVLAAEVLELELRPAPRSSARAAGSRPRRSKASALVGREGEVLGEQAAAEERGAAPPDHGRSPGDDRVERGGKRSHAS